ncbi:DUF2332 domain-containing protein [Nocardioides zeae]|uniref:DUF2332 domain-containing protein n=1 Tax=Nocardioides imazamoxiresistens TaxID=3231893 RepID=A0ABU3Q1J9_9ACTN|nr:DUF2332 domain-containing protein [Nocardioides zeae]MDT9594900.1 DUF2332 domain-containing protein [Nocardioides zeae]
MTPAEAFRQQGRACGALGSPMYADLCALLADDLAAGGPTARVLSGHLGSRGPDALALRLLGAVHRLVLERRAGSLATFYPSVGGTWAPAGGGAAVLALLERSLDDPELGGEVAAGLALPPQTNEPGRAAALVGALLHLPDEHRLPVHLVELGASAGLNLRADHVRITGAGPLGPLAQGPEDAGVRLDDAWRVAAGSSGGSSGAGGPWVPRAWPDLRFAARSGVDIAPVDAASPEGRLRLGSYVWPDQRERWERLRAALALAAQVPIDLRRGDAAEAVEALEPVDGALTVVWHSVVRQYLPAPTQERLDAALDRLLAAARPDAPVAHVSLEPRRLAPGEPHRFVVTLRARRGGAAGDADAGTIDAVLGTAAPHGVPCVWGAVG